MGDLSKFGEFGHEATMLARVTRKFNLKFFLTMILSNGTTNVVIDTDGNLAVRETRPTTAVIANVTLDSTAWTQIGGALSDVLNWRLSERAGATFRYAYVAAPGNDFATAFGSVAHKTAPTAIYVQRTEDEDINIALETYTA